MPTGTNWSVSRKHRAWQVVIGYNLPFVLWTLFALLQTAAPVGGWPCPVQAVLHVCPSCGLTGAYTQFLRGGGMVDWRLGVVLMGFAANGAWSIAKAANVLRAERERCRQSQSSRHS